MADIPRLALSVRQPWPWGILVAGKEIENRTWWTAVRGPIALHAGLGMTRAEYEDFLSTCHTISYERPFPAGLTLPPFKELPRGGIVGVVDIVDCVTSHPSPWFFGPYGFVLANARPVDFIPVKGALGFFDWRKNLNG